LDHPAWVFSELAYITQVPKEFDFENPLLPPQFHHTGPFHDGKGRPKVDFPWDRLTGEPLIYASMGTWRTQHCTRITSKHQKKR
jgi:zeaxanthin glucosyltransferase